jgi:hypothetical protein
LRCICPTQSRRGTSCSDAGHDAPAAQDFIFRFIHGSSLSNTNNSNNDLRPLSLSHRRAAITASLCRVPKKKTLVERLIAVARLYSDKEPPG